MGGPGVNSTDSLTHRFSDIPSGRHTLGMMLWVSHKQLHGSLQVKQVSSSRPQFSTEVCAANHTEKGAKHAITSIDRAPSAPVQAAIDISLHRHEVLIEVPGKKRRQTVLNTLDGFNRLIKILSEYELPVRIAFQERILGR